MGNHGPPLSNHHKTNTQTQDVGPCPSGTKCSDVGDIPYCQTTSTKRGQSNSCSAPGTYSCTGDKMGINVCDSQNQLVFNGACPTNTHCGTLNGLPFCVENGVKGY